MLAISGKRVNFNLSGQAQENKIGQRPPLRCREGKSVGRLDARKDMFAKTPAAPPAPPPPNSKTPQRSRQADNVLVQYQRRPDLARRLTHIMSASITLANNTARRAADVQRQQIFYRSLLSRLL